MQLYKLVFLEYCLQLLFQKAQSRNGKGSEGGDRGDQRYEMAPRRGKRLSRVDSAAWKRGE